ncbi:MAG: hypothetical protein WCO06_05780 [Candidatus Roizmanbacteria bacterium]
MSDTNKTENEKRSIEKLEKIVSLLSELFNKEDEFFAKLEKYNNE